MKKTKQIDTYYCDYCGKECEHTPEFVLPSLEPIKEYAKSSNGVKVAEFIVGENICSKQKDICPECQKKIISLLNLTNRVTLGSRPSEMTITF